MYARLQFSQFLNGWSYSAIETVSIALSVVTEKVSSIVAVSVVTEKVTADTFFKKVILCHCDTITQLRDKNKSVWHVVTWIHFWQ